MPPLNDNSNHRIEPEVVARSCYRSSAQTEALFSVIVNQYELDGSLDDTLCDLLSTHIHQNSLALMKLSDHLAGSELPF